MTESNSIKGLDGLRAIAVILVLANHSGSFELLPNDEFYTQRLWLLFSGETGVMIFFTLSGFLITHLLIKERNLKGKINYRHFIMRRALRLMPALIMMMLIYTFLVLTGVLASNKLAMILGTVYLYNYIPQRFNVSELTHTWSLAVEEQFYILWPLILRFFSRNKLYIFMLFVLLLSLIFIFIIPTIHMNVNGRSIFIAEAFRPMRWLIPAILPVMSGAALALWMDQYKQWKGSFSQNVFIVVSAILFYLTPLFFPTLLLPFCFLLQSVAVTVLIFYIFNNPTGSLIRILEFPVLAYIGKISYGLYLYQGLFLRTGPGSEFWFQQFPQQLIFTFGLAILSYHTLEKYFNSKRNNYR